MKKYIDSSVPILCLTGTATNRIMQEISAKFKIDSSSCYVERENRNKLFYHISRDSDKYTVKLTDRYTSLLGILAMKKIKNKITLIYVAQRKTCESLFDILKQMDFKVFLYLIMKVQRYHAGLALEEREKIEKQFNKNKIQILITTSAYGMGIDKRDITVK